MDAYLLGVNNSAPSTTVTNYGPVEGGDGAWQAAEASAEQVIPHALTLDKLVISIQNAPGAGKSYTATVMVNGVASALTCAISGASATLSNDLTHSLSLNAGDTISLRIVPASGPAATGTITWITRQVASGQFAILAGTVSPQTAARFMVPQGSQNVSATETQMQAPCPIPGVAKNLYVKVTAAPGGSGANAWTVTFRKALTNTTLQVVVTDPATTGNDTSHTVSVAAGDLLTIGTAITGTPASASMSASYTFVPTTDGNACWMHANGNTPSTGVTNYDVGIGGASAAWSTTEAPRQHLLPGATIKAFYVRTSAGPGTGGKQYVLTVRVNGAGTTLTLTLTGAAAANFNITGQSVVTTANDKLALESVPSSTPFTTSVGTGIFYTATTTAPQTGSAQRDVAIGGYTDQAGGVTGLFAELRDSSDSNYIVSSLSPVTADVYDAKLDAFNPPADGGVAVQVDFRYEKNAAGGDALDVAHSIYQGNPNAGGSLIHSKSYTNIANGFITDTYSANLSGVTNWGDLWERISTIKE